MTAPGNSHFWKIQRGEAPHPPIAKTLNYQIDTIDVEGRRLSGHFLVDDRFLNPVGQVQGGILTAMLDCVMGPAAGMLLGDNEFAPTLDLNVSFIRPGRPGKFFCTAEIAHRGKSICFATGELFDQDRQLVARATSTAIITVLS